MSCLRFRNALLCSVLAVSGLVSLSGCGDGGPKLAPVSGRVTVNGKAVTSGSVTFKPDKTKGNNFGGEPVGQIGSDGQYTIETNGKPGAPLGAYKVLVSRSAPTTEDNTKVKAQPSQNMTYLHPDTTPLAVEVVENAAAGAYDLKLSP
jgi:hypothetical protein